MATIAGWRRDLIRSQVARSTAFDRYLSDLRAHEFASKLPQRLIPFFSSINEGIARKLAILLGDADFSALSDEAAESHLVRYSDLYRYLYRVTSILEYVETSRTILEFGTPLQRVVTGRDSPALILLHALPEVNYSWEDLVGRLVQIANRLEIDVNEEPPAQAVWAIGFPGLQPRQTLVHTLLFHELGHGICQSENLPSKLRDLVTPDQDKINDVVASLSLPAETPIGDVKHEVGRLAQSVLLDWLEEIACDLIGYRLAGPAFIFAAISFLPSLTPIDRESEEYPALRLRLHLLFRLMNADLGANEHNRQEVYLKQFPGESAGLLVAWDERTANLPDGSPFFGVCVDAILRAFSDIDSTVREALGNQVIFTFMDHAAAIRRLVDRLALGVPPDEIEPGTPADPPCILNAGWLAYYSLVEKLAEDFHWDVNHTSLRIEDWTAKALELQEVLRRWHEVLPKGT